MMDSACEDNSSESFLKIDTIWSEAEENYESIAIKEEIVSDLEAESDDNEESRRGDVATSRNAHIQPEENEKKSDSQFNSKNKAAQWQLLKKKTKNGCQNLNNQDSELPNDSKSTCLHETKRFKIVNRRLRCGDCRSLVCPECFKIMFSTIHNHFLGIDASNFSLYWCKFCSFPFQSICALQAHNRIHTMETPFVCPDCGLIYSNAYFLILHLINKCFHIYKIVSYKCQCCPGSYFTSDTFLQHIQDSHLSSVFRCSYCSLLFNNHEELNDHTDGVHQKQKVQYINYFRCTLCSDTIIPSFMYEKHISQHRENSDCYEVEYRCICGDACGLIGSFRAHMEFCDKKGILPPQWGFLQKNLKTQDAMPLENSTSKEDGSISGSNSHAVGNGQFSKSSAEEVGDEKTNSSEKKGDSDDKNEGSEVGKDSSPKSDEITVLNNTKSALSSEKQENGDSDKTDEKSSTAIFESPSIKEGEKFEEVIKENSIRESNGENEIRDGEKETDGDSSKVFYDYIPCDHMGYVKIQGSKALSPESMESNTVSKEKNEDASAINYRVVLELDEKTGLMVSKKAAVENSELEDESNADTAGNYCDDEGDNSLNGDDRKFHTSEKGKLKSASSFFTCPFCVVMFPKHTSTFQQFRLHLEYYHPDAALNITVGNEGKFPEDKIKGDSPSDGTDKINVATKHGFRKNKSGSNARKKSIRKRKQCMVELDSVNLENEDSMMESEDVRAKRESESNEDEKENETKEGNDQMRKKSSLGRRDIYWTVKLSMKSGDDDANTKDLDDLEKSERGDKLEKSEEGGGGDDEEDEKLDKVTEDQSITVGNVQKSDGKNNKRSFFGTTKRTMKSPKGDKISEGEQKNEDSLDGVDDDCFRSDFENSTVKKKEKMVEGSKKNDCSGSSEKKTGQSASDYDEDWDNSKDSSWSNDSEFPVSAKDEKSDFAEDYLTRPKAIEKSRRESEVWSEFYESLQLAEKLKKKKKQQNHVEAKKKSSTLIDYSSKRVVKKPKRYRETSESDYSIDENENSESETELPETENNFPGNESFEGREGNEFRTDSKKQILLSKLKNVDQKLIDYLFDVITRKEKCLELYKKHSSLRASRYSQDLRSYRKKVLNGIKLRGKPLKLLRYQKVAKKNQSVADKLEALKEFGYHRCPRKNPDVQGGKGNEKKRGRPRKIMEAGRLKERRRSDKEVDFIEKNFEREESGSSPSKRKRKLSSKLQYYRKISVSDERDDFSSGQVITSKSADSNKKFNCSVCKESFSEQNEFREHIVNHRLEENTYQCMECGECFVVRPSLEKHLHAFHKIKNTDRYIAENPCCNPKKECREDGGDGEGEGEEEELKENQCKVCRDQFERAIDLTKHFRIHGMAFLREFKKDGKIKVSA